MTRFLMVVALSAVVATTRSGAAQLTLEPAGSLATAQELSSMAGGEVEATSVVSKALEEFLAQSHGPRIVTLAASQIREAWLPTLAGVRFARLDERAITTHHSQCGTFMWVKIERAQSNLIVTVGEGTKCRSGGQSFRFTRESNGWQPDRNGIRAGFTSGTSHCECS
jgi:hypothetical protein